jgi:hypothetical protein
LTERSARFSFREVAPRAINKAHTQHPLVLGNPVKAPSYLMSESARRSEQTVKELEMFPGLYCIFPFLVFWVPFVFLIFQGLFVSKPEKTPISPTDVFGLVGHAYTANQYEINWILAVIWVVSLSMTIFDVYFKYPASLQLIDEEVIKQKFDNLNRRLLKFFSVVYTIFAFSVLATGIAIVNIKRYELEQIFNNNLTFNYTFNILLFVIIFSVGGIVSLIILHYAIANVKAKHFGFERKTKREAIMENLQYYKYIIVYVPAAGCALILINVLIGFILKKG